MTQSRQSQISIEDTPYYHCISRCVRRAYLCGEDQLTHQSFEHRRQWIVDRIQQLSSIFAIQIAAYAVMSNHYHLVLHVDTGQAKDWSEAEVVQRWKHLYQSKPLVDQYLRAQTDPTSTKKAIEIIELWRSRLTDISWFMRSINEYIARKANQEDNCKGRFWEGRFKSQALLDEKALLACMAYVDLNPVRAKMADSVESSDFTSAQARIKEDQSGLFLQKFAGDQYKNSPDGIPFNLIDYLELVDWSGRMIREDKRGHIDKTMPKLLTQAHFDLDTWLHQAQRFGKEKRIAVGTLEELQAFAAHTGHRFISAQYLMDRQFS